jgi:hypothetical protein
MTSKLVLGMALGTSAAVGTAAVVGNGLTASETAGALALAGAIGVLNVRHNKGDSRPHTLIPLAETQMHATVAAPRAANLAAHPSMHDAA